LLITLHLISALTGRYYVEHLELTGNCSSSSTWGFALIFANTPSFPFPMRRPDGVLDLPNQFAGAEKMAPNRDVEGAGASGADSWKEFVFSGVRRKFLMSSPSSSLASKESCNAESASMTEWKEGGGELGIWCA